MNPRVRTMLFALVATMSLVTVVCQAQPQPLLTRHVRDVVVNAQAPFIGPLPATQSMRIDIVLALRDRAGLENLLQQIYDPSSPSYRHFVTVKQFKDNFGPSQQDFDALIAFARANGFTVTGGSRDATDVQLKGTVAAIETAFHLTLGLYHDPIQDRDFYAPDREPTVDLPFRLWHISGFDNYSVPRPALLRRPPGAREAATTGSCPGQSFCGSDMRAAYYEGTKLTGKGQNIGLLEFAGFDIADVDTYYKNVKQKRTAAVKGISVDGTSINCIYNQGCDDTVQTIDITQALGMAPGVTTAYMFVGSTDTALLSSMSTYSPLPLNLSSSWEWTPPDPQTDDPYFMKMAIQGQSFFNSSGNSEQWEAGGHPWPQESDYVICVGGTTLTTKGPGKGWASEVALSGAGGGISPDDIPIPSWQKLKGVITKKNEGSKKYRNAPDVSANAGFSFYVCADQSGCTANEFGGTAFSAPMWAGYLALANQQAAANGDQPPGFIDPTIYPLGLGKNYDSDFHDITSGSNGLFPATKGYDLASGWGSPNDDGLISALAGSK
jgi:subtilase family serine protease